MTRVSWGRLGNWAGALALTAMLVACGGGGGGGAGAGGSGSSGTGGGGAVDRAGIGPVPGTPVGTAYALPAGVQLDKPIKGDDTYCVPRQQATQEKKGSGGLVRLCLGFRNSNPNQPITVVLPPGLIFVSDKDVTQNGIVLTTTSIEVPAGGGPLYVPVYVYCLNKNRSPTAGSQDTYSLGPVTQDGPILDLIELLKGKTLPLVEVGSVQEGLWDITDRNGLTPEHRQAISSL